MVRSAGWGLDPGSTLGRYQILRGIARGGMGEVYLARMFVGEGDAHKLVAVKRILPHYLDDPALLEMFFNEGRVALLLDHPHVVQIFDLAEIEGEHIIAMEYIHGCSTRQLLKDATQGRAIPRGVALGIAERVASALHYVHQCRDPAGEPLGLVHRDVSPENVMVRYDGGVKLIDFGIARMSAHTLTTRVDVLKGKMGYMSPEQLRQDPLDHRSDVFQLGILTYELTTGVRLFDGGTFAAVMNQVLEANIDPPRVHDPDYPPELEAIVLRALAFEPEDRYDAAEQFGEALADFARTNALRSTDASIAQDTTRRFGGSSTPDLGGIASPATTIVDPQPRRTKASGRWRAAILAGIGAPLLAAGVVHRASFSSAASEAELAGDWQRWVLFSAVGVALLALAGALAWARRHARGAQPA